ncbi:hypothetical protein HPE56_05820 [Maribacter sp. ANRC-HE7]|uniref:Uncharacterized protein n=1 Tax=Maribacter aquimaris TaxID=2737171 RepID=A0ABR7V072_9FLAO|nr:hypothetical protein [Maribacter aquimaris]MBD0777305.1 hypothetical protein [Maribacter aquimaris]
MEKIQFLEKNIFLNLENLNNEHDSDSILFFSESDFEIILERIEKLGIGIYEIKPRLEGDSFDVKVNEDYRKKATDPRWYRKAFSEFKKQQSNLQYSATYKVSDKLLNRQTIGSKEHS